MSTLDSGAVPITASNKCQGQAPVVYLRFETGVVRSNIEE
jgi:hypothetical protein